MVSDAEQLLGNRYAPITSAVGYLQAPLETVSSALLNWRKELFGISEARVITGESLPQMLDRLQPLTQDHHLRELLVGTDSGWTASFDCSWLGTDPFGPCSYLGKVLGVHTLAIQSVPPPQAREQPYAARTWELFGPEADNPLGSLRSVSVIQDGSRWIFETSGTVQPFEDPSVCGRRRRADRFTPRHAAAVLRGPGSATLR